MHYTSKDFAPLPIRLIFGFGFVYHGWPKLFDAGGHQNFVGMLEGIGVPAAAAAAWLVAILEVFGGLALIVGALVGIVAALQIVSMLVAMFTVHLPNGFNFINITGMTDAGPQFGMPGYEVNLLYIGGMLALLLGGAGAYSVDQALRARRAEAAGGPSA